MPIPSQTGIPHNKLATKSMVMDMRHKCNYKIRKNKISRAITYAFARSIAFQNPIHPIVASQPSFAVARDISLPASLLIHRERLLNTFWSCYLQLKSPIKTVVHHHEGKRFACQQLERVPIPPIPRLRTSLHPCCYMWY